MSGALTSQSERDLSLLDPETQQLFEESFARWSELAQPILDSLERSEIISEAERRITILPVST